METNYARFPFSAAMIAGCEAALDAGIFYQDAFKAFVLMHMGGFDCEAVLVETVSLDRSMEDYCHRKRIVCERLYSLIKAAPRGHYALLQYSSDDGSRSFGTITSDGTGNLAPGAAYNCQTEMPSGEYVLDRMMGYEIYLCRQSIEGKRRMKADVQALTDHAFIPGMTFKDYRHPGEVKSYSKVVITAVSPATGNVKLLLVRHGTRKRWEASVGAKAFAERVGVVAATPERHPWIVVVKNGVEESHCP